MRIPQHIPTVRRFTINDFNEKFYDDDACLDWLMEARYPGDTGLCSYCKVERKHHRVASKKAWACDYCGTYISPMAGTIFEKSRTPLRLWFYAMYLMSATRCGISAKQIQRECGVTYKTAWRMFNQIRKLMAEDNKVGPAKPVEIDETYFGGRRKGQGTGRPGPNDPKKTPIVGIVERDGGRVWACTAEDVKSGTMLQIIGSRVLPETMIYTDEFNSYDGISTMKNNYGHRRIRHKERVYVVGDIHTNTIEGFWSLLKRGIGGVYHSVSKKHLQSYLDEYSFRYNRRAANEPMFVSMLGQVLAKAE